MKFEIQRSRHSRLLCLAITAVGLASVSAAQGASTTPSPSATPPPSSAPSVTTGPPVGVTNTGATVQGSVNPQGQATTYAVEYGATTTYTVQTIARSAGSGKIAVSVGASLGGLTPGTAFHYRLVATNATGTSAGGDQVFTTAGVAPPPTGAPGPQAVTGAPANVTAHSAVLTGSGVSQAIAGTAYFQYGPTASYGAQTVAAVLPAGPAQAFSIPVSALQAHSTYHYRFVVENAVGTTFGTDRTFQTGSARRVAPAGVTLTASRQVNASTTTIRVSGRVVLPKGVTPDIGCTGLVSFQIERGRSTVSSRRTVVRPDCTYASSVTINSARLGTHSVRAWAHFLGNDALGYRSSPVVAVF